MGISMYVVDNSSSASSSSSSSSSSPSAMAFDDATISTLDEFLLGGGDFFCQSPSQSKSRRRRKIVDLPNSQKKHHSPRPPSHPVLSRFNSSLTSITATSLSNPSTGMNLNSSAISSTAPSSMISVTSPATSKRNAPKSSPLFSWFFSVTSSRFSSAAVSSRFASFLFRVAFVALCMKLLKPDFSFQQSHVGHDRSRFLRGNNILLDSSVFTPRFVQDVYHYGGENGSNAQDEQDRNGQERQSGEAQEEHPEEITTGARRGEGMASSASSVSSAAATTTTAMEGISSTVGE